MDTTTTPSSLDLMALNKLSYICSLKFFTPNGDPMYNLSDVLALCTNFGITYGDYHDNPPFLIATYCNLDVILFPYQQNGIQYIDPTLKQKFVKLLSKNNKAYTKANHGYDMLPYSIFKLMLQTTIDFLKNYQDHTSSSTMSSLFTSSSYCSSSTATSKMPELQYL